MPYDPFRHASDPDADDMPPNAADVLEALRAVQMHAGCIQRAAEDLEDVCSDKADAVYLDADGYTYSHVKAWREALTKAADAAVALADLVKLVRAA